MTATLWLVAATTTAAIIAPPSWKLRVIFIGAVTLLPGVMAFFPSPATAWLAAACWAVPGVFAFVLNGLGFVWLVAAGLAFTGGVTEGHRRRHPTPRA